MGSIASRVKETVLGMNQQMEHKFSELDQIHGLEMHLRDQNNNQGIPQIRNSTPMQINSDGGLQASGLPMHRLGRVPKIQLVTLHHLESILICRVQTHTQKPQLVCQIQGQRTL